MILNSDIELWQKNILELPEERFFNIMRLYLGEIKTPYNKQRLTEQLASFLRNKDNLEGLLLLIDEFDLKILSAIHYMPGSTVKSLADFFSNEYSYQEIFSAISNLSDRLIIFSTQDSLAEQKIFRINPLIATEIKPMLSISCILEKPEFVSIPITSDENDVFSLSQNFLAAFISYIKHEHIVCRNDGIIKKNSMSKLETILKIPTDDIQLLFNAFVNLGLVHEGQKYMEFYENKLEAFCNLDERFQYAFLCVSACARFSRDQLKKNAQLLLDCLASMNGNAYSAGAIERLAWLITKTKGISTVNTNSRFGKILAAAKLNMAQTEETANQTGSELSESTVISSIIDAAIRFGLFVKAGTDEKQNKIYKPFASNTTPQQKVLNVDSTFTVTLMPGLNLKELDKLTDFLSVTAYGIVTYFEITRNTIQNAFEKGLQPKDIFDELEKYTLYELPQNLKISVEDWYHIYSSAAIYYGYVIKVSEENIPLVKNNKQLCKLLKEEIAPGVYLLSVPVGSNIKEILTSCGWTLSDNIKTAGLPLEQSTFPLLMAGNRASIIQKEAEQNTEFSEEDAKHNLEARVHQGINLITKLKKQLEDMEMPKSQKETLAAKISARMIISEQQLSGTSVRTEILEAEGMDYAGKIHLLEAAAESGNIVEMQMPNPNDRNKFITLIGRPLRIAKLPGECSVRFAFEPEGNEETILVSRITYLKRLIM